MRSETRGRRRFWLLPALAVLGGMLNFLLGSFVHLLQLPVFLDSVFTMIVTIHLGLPAGILAAVVGNGLLSLTGQVLWPFMSMNVLTAFITFAFVRMGTLRSLSGYLWMGIAVAAANGFFGSVLAYYLLEGVTEVHGIDRLVLSLAATGASVVGAVFWAGMLTNVIDKTLSAVLACFVSPWLSAVFEKAGVHSEFKK